MRKGQSKTQVWMKKGRTTISRPWTEVFLELRGGAAEGGKEAAGHREAAQGGLGRTKGRLWRVTTCSPARSGARASDYRAGFALVHQQTLWPLLSLPLPHCISTGPILLPPTSHALPHWSQPPVRHCSQVSLFPAPLCLFSHPPAVQKPGFGCHLQH